MSYNMHDTFARREDWQAARLTEIEFEDMVRALRKVAAERGQDATQVVERFAEKGLAAALGALGNLDGAGAEADFCRKRAQEHGRL